MFTDTRYASQIHGVNTSTIPTATMVKTDFDAGTSQLTGYIYGDTYNELETPVNGRADLAAFKVAALAAIEADFATRYAGRATLSALDFTIAVVNLHGLNVVASALSCYILFNGNEEGRTQFQNVFGLVFDTNKYVLADALSGSNTSRPATTLLAQQGRQPLQIS